MPMPGDYSAGAPTDKYDVERALQKAVMDLLRYATGIGPGITEGQTYPQPGLLHGDT